MGVGPYQPVLEFWFDQHTNEDRFGGKPEFDQLVIAKFSEIHSSVGHGEGFVWRQSAEGRLAEIIVLDQFSRQIHRGKGTAFAFDGMALALAQEMVAGGHDASIGEDRRFFAYMPFMHTESLAIQDIGVHLFSALGDEDLLKFQTGHRNVIARFGRFPRRNIVLGRQSTDAELAYIEETGNRAF